MAQLADPALLPRQKSSFCNLFRVFTFPLRAHLRKKGMLLLAKKYGGFLDTCSLKCKANEISVTLDFFSVDASHTSALLPNVLWIYCEVILLLIRLELQYPPT